MKAADPSWKIVVSQTGDFTRAGGKQVMAAFLQAHSDINVLFAQNDDMAIGAIQSSWRRQEARHRHQDRVVRRVHDGFVAMTKGQINAIVECNPLLGRS